MVSVGTLIVARNAAETLREAICSALAEPIDELVLVDDVSSDETVEIAESIGDSRVRIERLKEHKTLGYARSVGLSALSTDFCFLLDSDDAFLPGRIERLSAALEREGSDFVADELELVEGDSGRLIRRLDIPNFLDGPPGLARLFERNYLPGIGQIGFRVKSMLGIGYDETLHGGEDTDFVLRALLAGARGSCVRTVGYRMRHFPSSVSRNRFRQASELCLALRKHDPEAVKAFLLQNGMGARACEWALYSLFVFRRQFDRAARVVVELEREVGILNDVLEPNGPFPYPERWRIDFAQGTLTLLERRDSVEARRYLERAASVLRLPECLNNLGVAWHRLGDPARAGALWEEAQLLLPSYADARENLSPDLADKRLTALPLRREASRSEY